MAIDQPTYRVQIRLVMPAPLKEALDKYAGINNQTVSYVIREAITRHINVSIRLARMYEHESNYDKSKAQNERRKQDRILLKALKETSPELIATMMQQATQNKGV